MPHHTPIPDLSMKVIDNGRLQLLEVLGAGAFGTVYRAHDRECLDTLTFRAVKVMPKVTDRTSERGKLLERECTHHKYVSGHPNIVKLHRIAHDSRFVYVVLDCISGGDLLGLVMKHQTARNDELIKSILIQLVDAMYACHQNHIYHRDMKPDNVLVSQDTSRVFLSDFGLSTTKNSGRSYMFRVGTANYMSPECYNVQGDWDDYDLRRNDIWAIGMIAVCMIVGRCPWRRPSMKDENFAAYVQDQRYLRAVLPISEEADEILRGIFTIREKDCIDLLTLRGLLTNIKTFYMSEEELEHAQPSAREIYDIYAPRSHAENDTTPSDDSSASVYLSASGESSGSEYSDARPSTFPRPVLDIADGAFSKFVNESELPAIAEEDSPAPPPFDVPPLPERVFTLGSAGSCSSDEDFASSSEEESEGPITPETHAQDPDVVVPELSEGAGLGAQAVKVDFQPFEKTRRSLTGPQFRVLGGLVESVSRMLTTA